MKKENGKKILIFLGQLAVIALLVGIDQLTKYAAEQNLIGERIVLIKNFLALTYVQNTGAAFGSYSGNTFVLAGVTGAVIIAGIVVLALGKIKGKLPCMCAVMILAGGIGNLIDRIANNYVIDFIETLFIDFPVFNFADILVTCGVFIAIIYMIYDSVKEYKEKKNAEQSVGENG